MGVSVERLAYRLNEYIKDAEGQSLPHHEMLECVPSLFEVETKIVHDGNVIGKFLR